MLLRGGTSDAQRGSAAVPASIPATSGKRLIDPTNVLVSDFQLAFGFTAGGAEELQKKVPSATVVKAFNTVFAEHVTAGQVEGIALPLFVAGDDQGAKEQALALGRDIGFDSVDQERPPAGGAQTGFKLTH